MMFPLLETEALVQEQDKTRLSGVKSFAQGVSITKYEIKPDKTTAAIDVTELDKVLDWVYEFKIDVDATNDKVAFSDNGDSFSATLTHGAYTLAALAALIQTAMNALGGWTYAVTVSATGVFTFSADGGTFSMDPTATRSILPEIGFLDAVAGEKTYAGTRVERVQKLVTLTLTDNAVPATTKTLTKIVEVISEAADNLFSTDEDLRTQEPDIMRLVPEGRATFKDTHRRAQTLMLAWMDTQGFTDALDEKFTPRSFVDISEVREWSTRVALRLIFSGAKTAKDDVFADKAETYGEEEVFFRDRAVLRLDLDQDGKVDKGESVQPANCVVVRR